jgi:hypothetical protein
MLTLLAAAFSVTLVSAGSADTHSDRTPNQIAPLPFVYQGPAHVLPEDEAPLLSLKCSFTQSCTGDSACTPRTITAALQGQEIRQRRQAVVFYRLNVVVEDATFIVTATYKGGVFSFSTRHKAKTHLMSITPQGAIYTMHIHAPLAAEHFTGACTQ